MTTAHPNTEFTAPYCDQPTSWRQAIACAGLAIVVVIIVNWVNNQPPRPLPPQILTHTH